MYNGYGTILVRFPGQYDIIGNGLYYNYHRDYDPSTGRYLQSDPIGNAGGVNTYAYTNGNPVMMVDPLGLACLDPVYAWIYRESGGASFNQGFVEFSAGFGDSLTWGITRYIRQVDSGSEIVNTSSGYYYAGSGVGMVTSGGVTAVGIRQARKGLYNYRRAQLWPNHTATRRATQQRRLSRARGDIGNGISIVGAEITLGVVKGEIEGAAADLAAKNTSGSGCECE